MKLTSFTDYSLRVLIYLAVEPGRRATVAEISTAFGVSENHLTKVVHFLGKAGWLANMRGKGGGLALAMPASEIVIGQVVRQTEGTDMPAECFGDAHERCRIERLCALRGALRHAVDAFYGVLDDYTLADFVRKPAALGRILFAVAA